VGYIKLDGITNSNGPDVQAWQAAIQQSGRPMVLNITQGSYTIKLAPVLKEYANQWEFAPEIEINGPDEGSANSCNSRGPVPGHPAPLTAFCGLTWPSVSMVKGRGGPSAMGERPVEAVEVADRFAEMAEQGVSEIHRQPVAHDDALDCAIGQVGGHRVCGH
jgi:hypothetical protein